MLIGGLIFAIVLFLIIKAVSNAPICSSSSALGKIGENEVSSVLRSLPEDYQVINNVIIPDQDTAANRNYTTQIDHVVVSPYGIFVIETKNYSGWIFGSEKSKRWKETFKTTQGHYFYNPIKQNWGHTYALAERLRLSISVFKPIVVFSDNCELNVDSTSPVVYTSQLKAHILNYTQEIIPRSKVAFIYNSISKINLVGEEIERRHTQSIGVRLTEKEMSLKEGKCPLCGGELKPRNGKYGSFYGCSNYPKCRFTYKVRS